MSTTYKVTALTPFSDVAAKAKEALMKAGMQVKVESEVETEPVYTGNILSVSAGLLQVDAPCLCSGTYLMDATGVVRLGTEEDGEKKGRELDMYGNVVACPIATMQHVMLEHQGQRQNAMVTQVTLGRHKGVIVWTVKLERTV